MPKTKKETIESDIVLKEEKVTTKPYFVPRLLAYIIDIMIVAAISSGIMFFLPKNNNFDKYMKEYQQIQTEFLEEKIDSKDYLNKSIDVVYDIDYCNVISMIIEVVVLILYFIVFQFYNKGQTFGKKLLKIRVISLKDQELTLNQMALRSLIINSVLINVLIIAVLLFVGRNYYYYSSFILQGLGVLITFVTLIMILFRKDGRGLHDLITGTKVVQKN